MQVNYDLVIDFARPNKSNTILISEGDKASRLLHFTLLANKQPMDMLDVVTATVKGIKQDGSLVYGDATILTDSEENKLNELEYTLPKAVSDIAGNTTMTVTLATATGATLTSFEFYIEVRNALYNEDDYISEEDLAGYKDLLNRTTAALAKMEVMTSQDALPNPYALNVSVDGTDYSYNGSDQVDINLDDLAHVAEESEVTDAIDTTAAAVAVESAREAKQSEDNAKTYYDACVLAENNVSEYKDICRDYSVQSKNDAQMVAAYRTQIEQMIPEAQEAADEALNKANAAIVKSNQASLSLDKSVQEASKSEQNAKSSAYSASLSESNTKSLESKAQEYASQSEVSASESKGYSDSSYTYSVSADSSAYRAEKSASEAQTIYDNMLSKLLDLPVFDVNFTTGEVEYESTSLSYDFEIDADGNLTWETNNE